MSTRPAIVIVVHAYPDGGGIASIVENYVAELREESDMHVAIVEARAGWDRLALPECRVHRHGWSNLINPLLFPSSLVHALRVGRWLRRLVCRLQPSLLVTQDVLYLGLPAVMATRGTATRVALMDHGTLTNVHEPGWMAMFRRRLGPVKGALFAAGFALDTPWRWARWRVAVHAADAVWYTGTELEPYFLRAQGRARQYSQTVPVDFRPSEKAERASARAEFGIPDGVAVVNMVGRLDGEKGLDTLVEALDADTLRYAPYTLLIAGDGSLKAWLSLELDRRGLQARVRMLGRLTRSEVRRLQAASDYHVYAGTISCGVSICLLEAMAAGVVPIASDVPTAQRELVGEAGWVFNAGDSMGLRAALLEALQQDSAALQRRRLAVLRRLARPSMPTAPDLMRQLSANVPMS